MRRGAGRGRRGLCGGDCSVDYDDPQCDDWAPQEDPACEACANQCRTTWTGAEYLGGQPFCTAPTVDAPGLTEVVAVAIRQVAVACATAHRVSEGWSAIRALADELEAAAALGGDARMCMSAVREVVDGHCERRGRAGRL